jgi:hypothetical protein
MLSKFYISNIACYFESFDSTLNYFRRLVALDRYSEKYIGSFVNIILHDKSDLDPIKKYLIMVDSSNIIKRQYKISISNPRYQMCRTRLHREYLEMI